MMADQSIFFNKNVALIRVLPFMVILCICNAFFYRASAQDERQNKPLVAYLNEDKTHFIKFSGYAQLWARYTELNPGSKVNESLRKSTADLSLRRLRMKMVVNLIDHFTLIFQGGTTNLTYLDDSESSFDLLDAFGEYKFSEKLSIGAGRSNWKGLTRFASGPTSTLLYDVPFLDLGNVNRTDLTLRNLNIFAKGQLGRLDYRIILAKPYISAPTKPIQQISGFNNLSVKPNLSAYLKWQFFEQESNAGSTAVGSYLGKKKVLALGIGAEFQKDLMWHMAGADTILNDMKLYSADVFYDTPINVQKGTSLNIYAAVFYHDYGPGYVRNLGINNMANGLDASTASFNGSGNAYPVVGTGNSFIFQTGFSMPYFNQQKKKARLMPVIGIQYSKFERLADPMFTYDLGLNLLLRDHASKFVFNAQSRPIYTLQGNELKVSDRKMMFVLMYHINID
ncbi:hypothetical protein [Pedobacter sp. R20-19]|uniref:hypothetical protein n=1 Tax=Pedobacter sp. R20-19 TaxID=1270196 RepID=UPI0004931DE3|nr:hypothetical protein [Pedobacter sp. R20-19]